MYYRSAVIASMCQELLCDHPELEAEAIEDSHIFYEIASRLCALKEMRMEIAMTPSEASELLGRSLNESESVTDPRLEMLADQLVATSQALLEDETFLKQVQIAYDALYI